MPEEEQSKVSGSHKPGLRWYQSRPCSCILLLCSMDQSVSPVMLLPVQSILDSAYINTQCLTNPYTLLIGLQGVLHSHW